MYKGKRGKEFRLRKLSRYKEIWNEKEGKRRKRERKRRERGGKESESKREREGGKGE